EPKPCRASASRCDRPTCRFCASLSRTPTERTEQAIMTSTRPDDDIAADIAWDMKAQAAAPRPTRRAASLLPPSSVLFASRVKLREANDRIEKLETKITRLERRLKAIESGQRQAASTTRLQAVK